ncbi:MAG: toll/interleukin-1 receptor domain-containing protein, partial [Atopobiaceae bacterium]|nr:toll/interleukin-1 receptor domain-containing protein [Atopobiaceae bacterium]
MAKTNIRTVSSPTVFISYSWDSDEHREWVAGFADYLRNAGADVLFDGNLKLGQRLPKFMEQSIAKADYVVIICTENYKAKADGRIGGVGY